MEIAKINFLKWNLRGGPSMFFRYFALLKRLISGIYQCLSQYLSISYCWATLPLSNHPNFVDHKNVTWPWEYSRKNRQFSIRNIFLRIGTCYSADRYIFRKLMKFRRPLHRAFLQFRFFLYSKWQFKKIMLNFSKKFTLIHQYSRIKKKIGKKLCAVAF